MAAVIIDDSGPMHGLHRTAQGNSGSGRGLADPALAAADIEVHGQRSPYTCFQRVKPIIIIP